MSKRIYIIHKWDGVPSADWYPWLKNELEKLGYLVIVPAMPDTNAPDIDKWVGCLNNELRDPDEEVFLVGHSIGCQTIMRYLEILPKPTRVGGVLFVAGWFNLKMDKIASEGSEVAAIAEPWLKTPIDTNKVKNTTKKFSVILSDNDPWVPLDDKELFEQKLGAKVIVQNNCGHFTEDNGFTELPIALEELLKIIND